MLIESQECQRGFTASMTDARTIPDYRLRTTAWRQVTKELEARHATDRRLGRYDDSNGGTFYSLTPELMAEALCRLGPDDDFVKVLDFGLVKHGQAAATVTALTENGTTAGTPEYMAPEIALGHGDVDDRADIYSLGCVAYYLLTGHAVFSADTPVAMALAHVQEAPVPPSVRSGFQIPGALEALILDCLAKDPVARPASAVVLGNRLAGMVLQDTWTQEAAHVWWDLHEPVTRSRSATAAAHAPAEDAAADVTNAQWRGETSADHEPNAA
jgi:Protein kinase domain